jgi:hypothetical protein
MRRSSTLIAAAAAVALAAVPLTAHAAEKEYLDRSAYDATVDASPAGFHIANATRGELGGYLDVAVSADDGSVPAGSNVCEPATADAVLTVDTTETLSTRVHGDLCTGFYGDSMTFNGAFATKDLAYDGIAHKKAKVSGEGMISVGVVSWFGGQASFTASMKW